MPQTSTCKLCSISHNSCIKCPLLLPYEWKKSYHEFLKICGKQKEEKFTVTVTANKLWVITNGMGLFSKGESRLIAFSKAGFGFYFRKGWKCLELQDPVSNCRSSGGITDRAVNKYIGQSKQATNLCLGAMRSRFKNALLTVSSLKTRA